MVANDPVEWGGKTKKPSAWLGFSGEITATSGLPS
jgi:hypothetical protein